MAGKKHSDITLIVICSILIVLGILILSSVSATFSLEKFGSPFYFLSHQIFFGLIPGLILAFLISKIKISFLKKWSPLLLLLNLGLLGMVFLPKVGVSTGGATRWVNLKIISLQPAEFLKLTFVIYLAAWLASKTQPGQVSKKGFKHKEASADSFSSGSGLIAFLVLLILISIFLILQPNISTLGVIVLVGILMYFSAGTPLWHSILIVLIASGGLLILLKTASYRTNRLLIFLNPELDPMGIGYQIKQALIGIGSGGLFGLGLGMSRQKFGFLPQPMADTIFAILAEELGFIGGLILIFLFLIFLWRGIKIAKNSPDKFSQLLALGISSWICLQAFINIGAMMRILPPTGIPLPFISYGGSHLIAELMGVGILLNLSKNTN